MNVFVLCAGRTASTTFANVSNSLSGYTGGHETLSRELFDARLDYPANHIEVDNRLSWFLGALDEKYSDEAVYVYIYRDREKIASSYLQRWNLTVSIVKSFGYGILMKSSINKSDRIDVCRFYADTVDKNIKLFLKDKSKVVYFDLNNAKQDFKKVCDYLNVECTDDILSGWDIYHNKNKNRNAISFLFVIFRKLVRKIGEIIK